MARAANPHLKQQLLDAALEVFATHGLAAARVSDITDRAGASKGAFYLHFPSKEAAYEALARGFLDDLVSLLRGLDDSMVEALPCGDLSRVAEADQLFMDFLWQRRKQLAMVLDGAIGTPYASMQDEFIDTLLHHMRESVKAHQQMFPEIAAVMDPEFAATMAAGIVFMYARRIIREHRPPFAAEQLLAFRALLAQSAQLVPSAPLAQPAGAPSRQPTTTDAA